MWLMCYTSPPVQLPYQLDICQKVCQTSTKLIIETNAIFPFSDKSFCSVFCCYCNSLAFQLCNYTKIDGCECDTITTKVLVRLS